LLTLLLLLLLTQGIYTTNKPPACAYIVNHSKSHIVFCEDAYQAAKFVEERPNLPGLTTIIQWSGELVKSGDSAVAVLSWEQFMALGDRVPQRDLDARIAKIKPGHCASLIYTSGTTGLSIMDAPRASSREPKPNYACLCAVFFPLRPAPPPRTKRAP
jgi:long-subunit acyl-CoA synthetase (AMP-forming)